MVKNREESCCYETTSDCTYDIRRQTVILLLFKINVKSSKTLGGDLSDILIFCYIDLPKCMNLEETKKGMARNVSLRKFLYILTKP